MKLGKKFGKNVRYWRKRQGLSQEDLADKAKLHPTYVSGIETGYRNPTVKVIERIAIALGVKPKLLFEDTSTGQDEASE